VSVWGLSRLSDCVEMLQQGGRQVSLSTFPSAFPKFLILNRFSEAVSDLHLFLLYDSSWQAWLLLIAAFVLLSVAFLPNSNLLPLLSWYMTYDCLSLSPHRFVVGFQLLLVSLPQPPPPNVKHHLANSDESILAVKSRVTNSLLEQEGGEVGVTKAILVLISFAASTRIVGR
jgi:hypothetical protein